MYAYCNHLRGGTGHKNWVRDKNGTLMNFRDGNGTGHIYDLRVLVSMLIQLGDNLSVRNLSYIKGITTKLLYQ